jgi:hypothetical protein
MPVQESEYKELGGMGLSPSESWGIIGIRKNPSKAF